VITGPRIAYSKVAPGAVKGMYAANRYFDDCSIPQPHSDQLLAKGVTGLRPPPSPQARGWPGRAWTSPATTTRALNKPSERVGPRSAAEVQFDSLLTSPSVRFRLTTRIGASRC
jgi:hypothetical protein